MAAYPNSVKAFTTKNPGDTIQSAHVNDLQDEVTAIASGLLSGTAPFNGGASTLASLSVTGNSTVAALQAGNSTVTNLSVTGNSSFTTRPVFPAPEAVKALSTNVGAANDSTYALQWTAQEFMTNSSLHSTGVNPVRFTPQTTGVFVYTVNVIPTAGLSASTGNFSLWVEDSSGMTLGAVTIYGSGGASVNYSVTAIKRFDSLAATPWLRAIGRCRDSSTNSASTASWAAMWRLT